MACSAAGGGKPGGRGGSTLGEAGGGSKGGSEAEPGGKSTTRGGGPVIVVPAEGGTCDGPCEQHEVVCGDGVLQVTCEECDDGNRTASDGCSDMCAVEAGYVCPVPGAMCRAAACGDGVLAGTELCDDGNRIAGDGCGETCTFETNYACLNGDDDVWVFVNGKLTVDISGTHGRTLDTVTVNATTTDIEGDLLNLTEGGVYEIVVFQAERNTSASTYGLSLDDFELTKSTCHGMCGDGIVTLDQRRQLRHLQSGLLARGVLWRRSPR